MKERTFPTSRMIMAGDGVTVGYALDSQRPGILPGLDAIPTVTHPCINKRMWACPCGRVVERMYPTQDGGWCCRHCGKLEYARQHLDLTLPGYWTIRMLRRRLGESEQPFKPLPTYPKAAKRKRAWAATVLRLEMRLAIHLGRATDADEVLANIICWRS
ncbi:hypothetical protein JQ625_27245 [Bradyrhizobium diazoefficiens]|nr:hypothetical protein [Bradyrhizobium diazoefficiens]MBR0778545.1 hypothetical protein [Bradyrhizobium diazoefficiens]